MKTQKLNYEQAKKIDLVRILAHLEFIPFKETEKVAWYMLPLRTSKEPSLKVNKLKNTWYDFTLNQGGCSIDLIVLYKKCSIQNAVAFLNEQVEQLSFHEKPSAYKLDSSKIEILEEKTIKNPSLISYLKQRRISLTIALKSCVEIHFKLNNQQYCSIGLKYESGGYELDNKNFKISTIVKDFCFINNEQSSLVIVQGMFNLMTLKTLEPGLQEWADILVLNSVSNIENILEHVKKYHRVLLFLDMNYSGRKVTKDIMSSHLNCSDRSNLYLGFEDLNDWLINLYE